MKSMTPSIQAATNELLRQRDTGAYHDYDDELELMQEHFEVQELRANRTAGVKVSSFYMERH